MVVVLQYLEHMHLNHVTESDRKVIRLSARMNITVGYRSTGELIFEALRTVITDSRNWCFGKRPFSLV